VGEFPEPVSVFPPPPKSVLLGKGGRAEVEFE